MKTNNALGLIFGGQFVGLAIGFSLWYWAGWSVWTMLGGVLIAPFVLFVMLCLCIIQDVSDGKI